MRSFMLIVGMLLASVCLAEQLQIHGTVLGPDARPIAGVQVFALLLATQQMSKTDARGAFVVVLPATPKQMNYPVSVLAYAPGFALAGGAYQQRDIIIHLQPAGMAWGRVLDQQGKPVAGVPISLGSIKQAGHYLWIRDALCAKFSTRTTADGRWTLGGVPVTGELNLSIDDPRFVQTSFTMTLSPDSDTPSTVTVRPGASITGKARFADGAPAARVKIMVQGTDQYNAWGEATTGADGNYTISSLPSSTLNVMLDDGTGKWVAAALEGMQVKEGETIRVADLLLTAGAIVEGTVTDENTGKPLANISVGSYGPHRPRSSAAIISTETDAEGRYRLRVAPGVSYVYIAGEFDDYLMPAQGVDITLHSGEIKTQSFRLRKGLTLSGELVDTNGTPLRGTTLPLVICPLRQPGMEYPMKLDGTSAFTLGGLSPGKWRFGIVSDDGACAWAIVSPQEITLPVDGPVTVTLKRIPLQTLRGRVITRDGKPIAGVTVELRQYIDVGGGGERDASEQLITNTEGIFILEQVRTDTKITMAGAQRRGYRFISGGNISTVNGQLHIDDILMSPLSGSLSGQVCNAEGKTEAGAKVIALEAGMALLTTTDATGDFTLHGLPEGEITLMAADLMAVGHAQGLTDDAPVKIRLTAVTAQPGQDLPRGYALLDTLLKESTGKNYYARGSLPFELAPYDLSLAIKLAKSNGMTEEIGYLAWCLDAFPVQVPEQIFAEILQHVEQIGDAQQKLCALATIGSVLATLDAERARALYTRAKALAGQGDNKKWIVRGYLGLAVLACKLHNVEAEALLDQAIAEARQLKDADDMLSVLAEGIAEVSPTLAEKVARATTTEEHRPKSALASVIESIARYDVAEACRLVKTMSQTDGPAAEYSYGYAAKYVVAALAKANPPGQWRWRVPSNTQNFAPMRCSARRNITRRRPPGRFSTKRRQPFRKMKGERGSCADWPSRPITSIRKRAPHSSRKRANA